MAKITVEEVIDLAFAVNEGDPFDWAAFRQGKEEAMKMIAASVIEQFNKEQFTQDDILIMISTITKLITENMILNTQLMSMVKKNEV
jgi:hypothetical protein